MTPAPSPTSIGQQTLENGLTLLWEEDHRQPLVALEARILGGSRGEGPWVGSGITHFLEHLLFKGTPTRPPGTIDQEVRRYGGTINAFTSHDYTGVTLFVETRFLPEALNLLADILQHATVPPEEFAKERTVVLSEIHMNHDDPDRRLHHLFWHQHYLVHPYRHPILGYPELLERLTIDDLRTFYHTQYVPNNIILACAGDFAPAQLQQLVQETFGGWARGAPYQILTPEEPPMMSAKRTVETLPVQAAYVMLGFPSTRLADPALYPLDVLANILGQGRSARLYEELVRTRQLVHAISAANYTPFDPGVFTVQFRTDAERVEPAIEAVIHLIEAVQQDGITDQELAKAQRQVVADYVFQRQTVDAKAGDLANAMALTGDPTFSARYVDGIRRVTTRHVQEAARQFLARDRMTVSIIQPPVQTSRQEQARPSQALEMTNTVLPNGLTVVLGVDHHLPMGVIVLVGRGGVRVEDESTQGVSQLTAQLLLKGTTRKTASDIAVLIESLGGDASAFSGRDGFGLVIQLLAEDLSQGLTLLHEVVTESTFPSDEVELQRQLSLKELAARDDDVFDIGSRALRQTLFGDHPYRFDPLGSQASLARLTRADCVAFAKQRLVSDNLILTVAGDFDATQMLQTISRIFGTLPRQSAPWSPQRSVEPPREVRHRQLELPKEQSVVLLGFLGSRVVADDRYAVDLLTAVLSGMSGRLFQAVREAHGLSYTLGAFHVPAWDPGYLVVYAATKPHEQERVHDVLLEQLQRIIDEGITEDELTLAKRYLVGSHRLEMQRLSGVAKRMALDELYTLGHDAWTTHEAQINAVTREDVQQAARRYLTLTQRAEVIVVPQQEAATSQPAVYEVSARHDTR